MKNYHAYQQALQNGESVTMRYLRFLFFGPPRSGKSSAQRRLIGDIVNLRSHGEPSISTGMSETNEIVIKRFTSEPVAIAESDWQYMKKLSRNVSIQDNDSIDCLAQLFCQLISKNAVPKTNAEPVMNHTEHDKDLYSSNSDNICDTKSEKRIQPEDSVPSDSSSEIPAQLPIIVRKVSKSEEPEIDNVFEELTEILQSDSPEDIQQLLGDLTMINTADIGGQPAFMDLLPVLVTGPALYFIFFRLDQQLNKYYEIKFLASGEKDETVLESCYCPENVLYQALSSIVCLQSHSLVEYAESSHITQTSSVRQII